MDLKGREIVLEFQLLVLEEEELNLKLLNYTKLGWLRKNSVMKTEAYRTTKRLYFLCFAPHLNKNTTIVEKLRKIQ